MRAPRARSRWTATALAGVLLLLLAANLPFYAGSTPVEGFSWRMEHGRLTLTRSELERPTGFWVDLNSEGLRWRPRAKIYGPSDWMVTLPLWMPLAAALAGCVWAWRPRQPVTTAI